MATISGENIFIGGGDVPPKRNSEKRLLVVELRKYYLKAAGKRKKKAKARKIHERKVLSKGKRRNRFYQTFNRLS